MNTDELAKAFAEFEDRLIKQVVSLLAENEKKFEQHVDRSAERTMGNSKTLADGLMAQSKRIERIVQIFAEGHSHISTAHGHMSEEFKRVFSNGHVDPDAE